MPRVIALVLLVALTVWCLVDIAGQRESSPRGLPKALWVVVVLVIPVLGPLVWLASGRAARREAGGRPRRQPPRRPMGPDDDPDFLKGI